jgi:aspartate carbamoyltransferase catalytic subunit
LGIQFEETNDLASAIRYADALYMTRIQKERFVNPADYDLLRNSFILTREMIEANNPKLTVLHPLPRVNEIATDVDGLPGAAYFRQAKNGVYVRMALLAMITGKM